MPHFLPHLSIPTVTHDPASSAPTILPTMLRAGRTGEDVVSRDVSYERAFLLYPKTPLSFDAHTLGWPYGLLLPFSAFISFLSMAGLVGLVGMIRLSSVRVHTSLRLC